MYKNENVRIGEGGGGRDRRSREGETERIRNEELRGNENKQRD